MPRRKTDNHQNITDYLYAILKSQGRNFTKCEFCGHHMPEGDAELHHEKYENASIRDIKIVCHRCNTQEVNRRLA